MPGVRREGHRRSGVGQVGTVNPEKKIVDGHSLLTTSQAGAETIFDTAICSPLLAPAKETAPGANHYY